MQVNSPKFILGLAIIALAVAGCNKAIDNVSIIRSPFLNVQVNDTLFKSEGFKLNEPISAVAYLSDTAKTGSKVYRYAYQNTLVTANSSGTPLQLIISFDTDKKTAFQGIYTTAYTSKGGLFEVTALKTIDQVHYIKYVLVPNANNKFEITRQGNNERIFAGQFHFELQNQKDSTDRLSFTNGKFEDINY